MPWFSAAVKQQECDLLFSLPNLFRLCRLWGNRSHGLSPLNQTPWTSSRANYAAWAILRFCDYASLREWAKMTSSHHLLCKCLTKPVAFCACCYLHFLLTLLYLISRELREKIQPEILELIKQQRLNRLCEGSSFRKIGNRRRQGEVTVSTAFFHVKNCRQVRLNGLTCQQACCQKGKLVTGLFIPASSLGWNRCAFLRLLPSPHEQEAVLRNWGSRGIGWGDYNVVAVRPYGNDLAQLTLLDVCSRKILVLSPGSESQGATLWRSGRQCPGGSDLWISTGKK